MKISDVYKELNVPPNLQEHMSKVCGIVSFIEKHWTGEEIDWDLVKKAALLHDLGNIVRFDFDNHPEFLGDEQSRIGHWREVQRKMIEKYGKDDHKATEKMLQEVGAKEELIKTVSGKGFGESIDISFFKNYPKKILLYADLRVLPHGIGTLEERIDDIRQRLPIYSTRPDFENYVGACMQIEKQIQQRVDIPLEQIRDESVRIDSQALLETEI